MAPPERDESTLRRYLLRTLPAEERDRLEKEALRDAAAFEDLQAAEDDLFHDYARGSLSDGERGDFEKTLLAQAGADERLAAARAFLGALDAQPAAPAARTVSWPLALAAAAALALVAWLLFRARPNEVPRQGQGSPTPSATLAPSPSAGPTAAPGGRVLALALVPGALRAGGTMPTAAVTSHSTALELALALPEAAGRGRLAVLLRTAEGNTVWTAKDLAPAGRLLVVHPPLDLLGEADYELVLSRDPGTRPLAEYRFRLLRE